MTILLPVNMISSVRNYLRVAFYEKFVKIPELNLIKLVERHSNCKSPILFCSPGHDASPKIGLMSINKKLFAIAIGSSEGFI